VPEVSLETCWRRTRSRSNSAPGDRGFLFRWAVTGRAIRPVLNVKEKAMEEIYGEEFVDWVNEYVEYLELAESEV